jgi:hypothetical protein
VTFCSAFFSLIPMLCVSALAADSVNYTFTEITKPGKSVQANAINNNGQIVGTFGAGEDGYVLTNGVFSNVDIPGSTTISVLGINDVGQLVGEYLTGTANEHAFLDDRGVITTFDFSGASSVSFNGINNAGQIVGTITASDITSGFIDVNGTITTLRFPGSSVTYLAGINNRGQIVGSYVDATGFHGFLYSDGVFTTVKAPVSFGAATTLSGINDYGVIAGEASDNFGNGMQTVFVDDAGVFTSVRSSYIPFDHGYPLMSGGINNLGQVVGTDTFHSFPEGFLATPVPVPEPSTCSIVGLGIAIFGISKLRAYRRTATQSL